jgi:dihydrofolate reductase
MVIGGASVYEQFLPLAQRVYATHVHGAFAGDVQFPDIGRGWRIMNVARYGVDNRNAHACDFVVWERMT